MNNENKPVDRLVHELRERAKELNCLYQVHEILSIPGVTLDEVCEGIIKAIPPGWQYPDICHVKIDIEGKEFLSEGFFTSPWVQHQEVIVREHIIGMISVYYSEEMAEEDEGPFLKEERKLIKSIAEQLAIYLLHEQLRKVFDAQQHIEQERKAEWWVILDLLRRTDPPLMVRISRKMVNFLIWEGITEARGMLRHFSPAYQNEREILDVNQPSELKNGSTALSFFEDIFNLAAKHMSEEAILERIQHWFTEDQSNFLAHVLVHPSSSLDEIDSAIVRYHHLSERGLILSKPREASVCTALIRRLLCDRPQYINTAKNFLTTDDFHDLMQRTIYSAGSHGMVGGKAAGIFLAHKILEHASKTNDILGEIKIPKTWYITSDTLFDFLGYNGLEDVIEHKYKTLAQIRQEYPYIVHSFKNSRLTPELIKNLQIALEDFGRVPLIVRSSSLLEDRTGMAFAGKYKSLFISNQGSKEERLKSLADAVAEVYASMFGPDPIEYRLEHELIDQHEEMGIIIQEVVGTKVGPYHTPAFAGVAFSSNQFPWSSRILPEDGLVRLVPGLGTRAVDRLSDDYPVMASPGKPGMRISSSTDEIVRYSPRKTDVIDLEEGGFTSIDFSTLIRDYWSDYPKITQLISVYSSGHLKHPVGLGVNYQEDSLVVTFENLFSRTPFLKQIDAILGELETKLGYPVDIEFAHDGTDFYLLQCRSQNFPKALAPAEMPVSFDDEKVLFSSNDYVTNGMIKNISFIVYVDPVAYSGISEYQDLIEVGKIIGKLNSILPRREFILIGPGRWGSRGDVKLGVRVTYADIRNTAMLIEIPFNDNSSGLDPSFGTHFFQDLVESSIRYLPLDFNSVGVSFNSEYVASVSNRLLEYMPESADFSKIVKVIDISKETAGQKVHVFMNANINKALGLIVDA